LIAALTLASIIAISAVAKAEKTRAIHVEPDNFVTCGRVILSDPDLGNSAATTTVAAADCQVDELVVSEILSRRLFYGDVIERANEG